MITWVLIGLSVLLVIMLALLTGHIQESLRRLDAASKESGFLESKDASEAFLRRIERMTDAKNAELKKALADRIDSALQERDENLPEYEEIGRALQQISQKQSEANIMLQSITTRLAEMDVYFQSLEIERRKALEAPPPTYIEPETPFENEFENWSSDWQSGIERVQYLLQNSQEAALQKLLSDLQGGRDALITDWERFGTGDPRKWSASDFRNLDFALHFAPALPKSLEGDARTQSLLQKASVAIKQLQNFRKEELRAREIERIEGVPGSTEQIAGEIEHDAKQPSAIPEQPEQGGKFCRIEPGMGGYRFQGKILRPTFAVFYKAYRLIM